MIKTGRELAAACVDVAQNYKTLYVMGCFGAPMTEANKERMIDHHTYNRRATPKKAILAATADTFGFDCVCLIKGLLWGWNGDAGHTYGGASYASNGVPDLGADQMFSQCRNASTDFSTIQVGEAVWMSGHIGIYIGDGLAVECTPAWKNCVQITAVHNIGKKSGYNGRNWTKHGKLPYVTYEENAVPVVPECDTEPVKPKRLEGMPLLKLGAKGETVRALQILLIGNGISCGKHGADGEYGPDTKNAVECLQEEMNAQGIPLKIDGECGPETWAAAVGLR